MKLQNKITTMLGVAAFGVVALSSCEGSELYTVNAPDWLASRIDSIAEEKKKELPVELDLMEDVYTFGKTDFSSGWWAEFSKYYVVPDGKKWQAQFNLNINPADDTYYKNFALIVANKERGAEGYVEHGAIRFDLTGDANKYNSGWGPVFGQIEGNKFKYTESTLTFSPDGDNKDSGLQKLAGKVTLTVDRTDPNRFYIEMNNGNAKKTFDMPSNIDAGNDIYCFICVEGSYINFLGTDIVPIGGCTSKEDKQPLSMTLKGVPSKVMIGTSLDSITTKITALVEFETGVSKEVEAKDLSFQAIPDVENVGTKTLIAAYSKTYKGEGAAKAVIANATFQVVDKMYTTIGKTDNTSAFGSESTSLISVKPGETYMTQFINYAGGSNWNNYVVELFNGDAYNCTLRADAFGWQGEFANNTNDHLADLGWTVNKSWKNEDWASWLAAMDGSKVTVYVTNNGDGTADVKTVTNGADGMTYTMEYLGIKNLDKDNLNFHLTIDNSHIEFGVMVGAENNSTGFAGESSDMLKVESGKTTTTQILNYAGVSNWNNFVIELFNGDAYNCTLRADAFGWQGEFANNTNDHLADLGWTVTKDWEDWPTWLAAMEESNVTISVTNNGDGTADVICTIIGNDGNTYNLQYLGIRNLDKDQLQFHITVDGSHFVFDNM